MSGKRPAFVTGGSSGIGLELARRLSARGHPVALFARDRARLDAARAELRAADRAAVVEVWPVDVGDRDACLAAVADAVSRLGAPGWAIANAGIAEPGEFLTQSLDAFDEQLRINYSGALYFAKSTAEAMARADGGRLVFVGSGAAFFGIYGYAAYAPTKFAMRALAEVLRVELAPRGITVTLAYPPDTDTPMLAAEERLKPEVTRKITAAGGTKSAGAVAEAILRGADRGRFAVTPGVEMTALLYLHSLIAPALRVWQGRIVRRAGARPVAFDIPTLALTCAVLLAAGYAVLGLCGLVPRLADGARGAWPVLVAETLIVGVFAGTVWAGGWLLAAGLAALSARVGYEAARVTLPNAPGLAWGAALVLAAAGPAAALVPATGRTAALLALFALALLLRRGLPDGRPAALLDLMLFPGIPVVAFSAAGIDGAAIWLLAGFILVETFDSYALLGGRIFGRRPAFPVLSPRKTVEGLIAGGLMLTLTAAGAAALLADVRVGAAIGTALAAGLLAVAGDLAASRLKRRAGVKDFPQVLAHQGGLLDIADAWIAAGAGLAAAAALAGAF